MQHFARLRLQRIAIQVFVFLLDLAEARENLVHIAGLPGIVHGTMQGLQLMVQIADATSCVTILGGEGSRSCAFTRIEWLAPEDDTRKPSSVPPSSEGHGRDCARPAWQGRAERYAERPFFEVQSLTRMRCIDDIHRN